MAIVSSMLIILALTSVAIDPYMKATNWGVNLFEFYENNNETNKIYFIGDSLPQWGIDSTIVEYYLQNKIHLTLEDVYDTEIWSGTPTNWMQEDSTIHVNSPENHTAILGLWAVSFYRNRTLVIYSGGVPVAQVAVPMSFINVSVPIYLANGENTVRFHVPEGCERPSDIMGLKSPDNRCLSVAIQNITLSGRKSDQLDKNKNQENQSFKVYNLAHSGDAPKTRIVELSYMAKSRPKIVVFCLQYRLFSSDHFWEGYSFYPALEDRFALSADKIVLDTYTKSFFDKTELDLIQMDYMHLIAYKRRLLLPALQLTLSKVPQLSEVPFIKPSVSTEHGIKPNFKVDFIPPKTVINETSPKIKIYDKSNAQEEALLHMINVLKSQGIHVIIITMPYKSEYLRSFSNESIRNYLTFINTTQCPHYDLISYCSDVEFHNNNHLNFYGRLNISIKAAEILRSEVINVTQ
jgi:hypothetical protein